MVLEPQAIKAIFGLAICAPKREFRRVATRLCCSGAISEVDGEVMGISVEYDRTRSLGIIHHVPMKRSYP